VQHRRSRIPPRRRGRVEPPTIKVGERALLEDVSLELAPGTIPRSSAAPQRQEHACRCAVPVDQVPTGTVFIDGNDVPTLPLASVRAQIGYAPQEAFCFLDDDRRQHRMGYGGGSAIPAAAPEGARERRRPDQGVDVSREAKVGGAPRRWGSNRDLAVMPEGLGTIVGERASRCRAAAPARRARSRACRAPRRSCSTTPLSSVRRRDGAQDPEEPAAA